MVELRCFFRLFDFFSALIFRHPITLLRYESLAVNIIEEREVFCNADQLLHPWYLH